MNATRIATAGIVRDAPVWQGWALTLTLTLCFAASGCSVRNYAVNSVGDALAASGTGFASDDDSATDPRPRHRSA